MRAGDRQGQAAAAAAAVVVVVKTNFFMRQVAELTSMYDDQNGYLTEREAARASDRLAFSYLKIRQHPGEMVLNFLEGRSERGKEEMNHLRFIPRTSLTSFSLKGYFRESEREDEEEDKGQEEKIEGVMSSLQALAERRQKQGLVPPGGVGGGNVRNGEGCKSPTKKVDNEDKKKKDSKDGGRRGLELQQQHLSPLQQKRAREREEESKARVARLRLERELCRCQTAADRAEASFARRQEWLTQAGGVGAGNTNPFETRQGPLKTLMCWVDEW